MSALRRNPWRTGLTVSFPVTRFTCVKNEMSKKWSSEKPLWQVIRNQNSLKKVALFASIPILTTSREADRYEIEIRGFNSISNPWKPPLGLQHQLTLGALLVAVHGYLLSHFNSFNSLLLSISFQGFAFYLCDFFRKCVLN